MIRSSIQGRESEVYRFPKLMVNKSSSYHMIVLFKGRNEGTIVDKCANSSLMVGFHATNWNMEDFEDFHGKLILENGGD